jgi:hypothetical protein
MIYDGPFLFSQFFFDITAAKLKMVKYQLKIEFQFANEQFVEQSSDYNSCDSFT